jgi:hypothetical protein
MYFHSLDVYHLNSSYAVQLLENAESRGGEAELT